MKFKTNSLVEKIRHCGMLCLFLLTLSVSCKKDNDPSETSPDSLELQKLAQWYQSKLTVSDDNPFSKMKPRWKSVHINEQASQRVYEVELENPERVLAKLGRPDRSMLGREEKRHIIRLLIFENRISGKILYASYMSAESSDGGIPKNLHYRNVDAFNGTVLFYHFTGVLSNGWSYNNGKIVKQITAITKNDFDLSSQTGPKGKVMANWDTKCSSGFAEKFKWGCVGAGNYENCGFTSAGYEYVTICTTVRDEDVPGHEDPPSPSGPGEYFPPIYVDCAGVENGNAYWNTECKTCMGGTTGITECPKEVKKTDSLRRKYPCLDKLVFNKLLEEDAFRKLIFPFTSNIGALPDITYTYSSQQWGERNIYALGQTKYNQNWDSVVELNSSALSNSSQLFVALALIHETGHAYANYHITTGSYGYPVTTADSTWAMKIVNYEQTRILREGASNYMDHSVFLENYFNTMVNILSKFGGSAYTLTEYRMAVLYGLDNAGPVPTDPYALYGYNQIKAILKKTYDKIVLEHGINTTTMNTFWRNNTSGTPSGQKLPSICP